MKVDIVDESIPAADEMADKVKDKLISSMHDQESRTSWLPSLPNLKFGKPSKDWEKYNGRITKTINSVDEDFKTAKLGEAVEMCADSLDLLPDTPLLCLGFSGAHVLYLKGKSFIEGKTNTPPQGAPQ
jgi:hypothetical protein